MGISRGGARYPDFKEQDIGDPKEFSRKLSELTKTIDDQFKRNPHPYEVYGRTLTINSDNLEPDGTTIIGGNTYEVYEFTIPSDVGTVFINYPEDDPFELININLPNSLYIEGRTISFVVHPFNNTGSLTINTIPDNTFVYQPTVGVPLQGSLPITTNFAPVVPGQPTDLPLYAFVNTNQFGAGIPSSPMILPVMLYDAGPGNLYGPIQDTFNSTADISNVGINLGGSTVFSPLQVRAYFDHWLLISTL
jgi:hypothetical protein